MNIKAKRIWYALLFSVCISSCTGQEQNKQSVENKKENQATKIGLSQSEIFKGYPKFKKSAWAKDHDGILCSLKDSKGRLWFGTSGGGVYCYEDKLFRQYTSKDGLSHDMVGAIYEDKNGTLWFGTSDGITTWDGKSFTKISITTIRGKNAKIYQPTTTDPTYGVVSQENEINDIIQDSKGHFWFAATGAVYRYDGKTYTNFTVNDEISNSTGVKFGWIERIMEDKEGKIWFGGRANQGLFCFDGNTLTNLKPNLEDWLQPLLKDKEDNVWFGNFRGVYRYNGKSFGQFSAKQGLCFEDMRNAFEDKAGNLWFIGDNRKQGVGICKYDGKSFQNFPISVGKTEKFVVSIIEDKEGNLWVGVRGCDLYRFDGKTFTLFSE
jgi:ligand-binding sensor domain-containing protein